MNPAVASMTAHTHPLLKKARRENEAQRYAGTEAHCRSAANAQEIRAFDPDLADALAAHAATAARVAAAFRRSRDG